MRLFRQKQWGDWEEVFERIAEAVRSELRLTVAKRRVTSEEL